MEGWLSVKETRQHMIVVVSRVLLVFVRLALFSPTNKAKTPSPYLVAQVAASRFIEQRFARSRFF